MKTKLALMMGLALALMAGCSSTAADKRREFRQDERERQEERRQDLQELREKEAREADPVVDVVADWEKLGERTVDGYATDHDMIQVGLADGRFSRLKLRVTGGDMVLQRVLVVFHDGEHYYPHYKLEFKENSRSHDIDLPGKRLAINRVEFWYTKMNERDTVTVELFGR
ncbi:MAG: hypothetical protein IT462_17350 [Planctomycetes bacterium]|nr:hypothetical protein [Planctomycetota bacterium]